MTTLAYTATPHSINILLDGRMRTVDRSHLNFAAVQRLLQSVHGDWRTEEIDAMREMIDIPSFIAKVTEGSVQVGVGEVRFHGKPVHNYISQRLLEMLQEGYDIRPLARFMERLDNNPYGGDAVKEELYRFLERGGMPLTPDGCFIAFKRVREDFSSINQGPGGEVTYNRPGERVEFPRERLNLAERGQTCSSSGLHCCSYGYLPNFHAGSGNKVVTLKCAPEDVWSIPAHENDLKCQMVGYWVLDVVPDDEVKDLFADTVIYNCDTSGHGDDADNDGDYDDYRTYVAVAEVTPPPAPVMEEVKDELQARLKAQSKAFKKRTGRSLASIRKLVKKHGQREASRRTGIPRTTLQRYL